ncbi:hypothetical protein [Microcystis phage Mwe-JY08]
MLREVEAYLGIKERMPDVEERARIFIANVDAGGEDVPIMLNILAVSADRVSAEAGRNRLFQATKRDSIFTLKKLSEIARLVSDESWAETDVRFQILSCANAVIYCGIRGKLNGLSAEYEHFDLDQVAYAVYLQAEVERAKKS